MIFSNTMRVTPRSDECKITKYINQVVRKLLENIIKVRRLNLRLLDLVVDILKRLLQDEPSGNYA